MIERTGNLWEQDADAYVITTNGFVKKNGAAVMGAGVARQARDRYPGLDNWFGMRLEELGNHVIWLMQMPNIISFPVKHNWWEDADPELIERSAQELADLVDTRDFQRITHYNEIAMVRPGCGNGNLDWGFVKMLIEDTLDDRFVVYELEQK